MIATLARAFLVRRLRSVPRLLFIVLLGGVDLSRVILSGQAGPAEGAIAFLVTYALGVGLIGQERADGSLSLLLTRPVARSSLVLAAWISAVTSGLAAWLALTLLRLALVLLPGVDANWSGEVWRLHGLTALGGSLGLAAIVVFFGVAFRGLGGPAAHASLIFLATTVAGLASDSGRATLQHLAKEGLDLLLPVPDFGELLAPGGWSWLAILTPASNATLALLAACWLLGRAQLSYSSRGEA